MDYKFLITRVPFIIFHPVKAWDKISAETSEIKYLRNNYLFPLIVIVALASFFGSLFITNSHLPVTYSLFEFLKFIILSLFVVFLSSLTLKEMTYALDLGRNFNVSFTIIVYSLTPLFLCLIISQIFDSLVFMDILALYGLYIFWTGSEKLLTPAEHKKMPMTIATAVVVIGYYIAAAWFLNQLSDRIYYRIIA